MIFNFATFVTIVGILMNFAYLTQSYKIIKTKSVKGVSLITYLIFASGISVWLIYGISIKSSPIIISNVVSVIGAISVVILYLIYSKKESRNNGK